MNNTMEYKGYVGSVEFSEEDVIFYGKVMGIRSLISYEGENARELVEGFHEAVQSCLCSLCCWPLLWQHHSSRLCLGYFHHHSSQD